MIDHYSIRITNVKYSGTDPNILERPETAQLIKDLSSYARTRYSYPRQALNVFSQTVGRLQMSEVFSADVIIDEAHLTPCSTHKKLVNTHWDCADCDLTTVEGLRYNTDCGAFLTFLSHWATHLGYNHTNVLTSKL